MPATVWRFESSLEHHKKMVSKTDHLFMKLRDSKGGGRVARAGVEQKISRFLCVAESSLEHQTSPRNAVTSLGKPKSLTFWWISDKLYLVQILLSHHEYSRFRNSCWPRIFLFARLAQLARAPRLHRGCRGFKSLSAHQTSLFELHLAGHDVSHQTLLFEFFNLIIFQLWLGRMVELVDTQP